MKIPKKVFLLSLLIILTVISCSKNNENDETVADEIYIKYTASGENYNYIDPVTTESANISINGKIANSSADADYSFISIWFPLDITTGTFDFTGDVFTDGDYKLKLESNPLNIDGWATSGSVTITSINAEYIEGSFTATVTEDTTSLIITAGEFKAFGLE